MDFKLHIINLSSYKSDEELKTYSQYIKNTTQNNIVSDFCSKYIFKSDDPLSCMIEWKYLHFVWKQFLSDSNFPSVIYSSTLKNLLTFENTRT